ncbi:unnamed protein product [Miscanthus lutarioriparius]|uniref:AAA+ ATPase domain-containing protein n=1 Tax=Miscanthus lutarioriparius TaxID=422564 RepID=A0A811QHT9_9POAL|nr:unnamed protein product [Miscanthus lutarioriparius]
MAGFGLLWSRMPQHVHDEARHIISSLVPMVMSYFNPYEQITVSEYGEERFEWNKMFCAVSTYLRRACLDHASKLKGELGNNSKDDPLIRLDKNQEVVDNFDGARMWWRLCPKSTKNRGATVISLLPGDSDDEPRCYRLVFHKRQRKLVLDSYLPRIVRQEEQVDQCPVQSPATFDMLAMDHSKNIEIMEDLTAFRVARVPLQGRQGVEAGYFLHGPSGTSKSTMIGAMANFLEYDVYDLDVTSIKDNAELRKLFLDTMDRSIIVIEDIDAIEVELTTKRKGKEAAKRGGDNHLRIFVFTTNHVDRLDPALIRRGRMDRHIEMSYCRFEAFKMLAKSYQDITEHSLFGEIGQLLDEIDTTPADVAGNLMLRVKRREADDCLAVLVETLKKAKMKAAAPPMDSVEEAKEE